MRAFIFVTFEGHTYQPNSEAIEPDIENLQVIGFATGENEEQAFQNLILENEFLKQTSFDESICFELKYVDYFRHVKHFYLQTS